MLERLLEGKTVLILGAGADLAPSYIVDFYQKFGASTFIYDVNKEKLEKVARETKSTPVKEEELVAVASIADIVEFCLPQDVAPLVVKEIAPHMKDGALITDITGIKYGEDRSVDHPRKLSFIQNAIDYSHHSIGIVGKHPMGKHPFDFSKGRIIFTPAYSMRKATKQHLEQMINMHEALDCSFLTCTPQKHDKMMAIIQGIHLPLIAIGHAIRALDVDLKEVRDFASPPYKILLDLICRIHDGNPRTYALIQTLNPHIPFFTGLIAGELRLLQKASEKGDTSFIQRTYEANKKHLGRLVGEGTRRTDQLIGKTKGTISVYYLHSEREIVEKYLGVHKPDFIIDDVVKLTLPQKYLSRLRAIPKKASFEGKTVAMGRYSPWRVVGNDLGNVGIKIINGIDSLLPDRLELGVSRLYFSPIDKNFGETISDRKGNSLNVQLYNRKENIFYNMFDTYLLSKDTKPKNNPWDLVDFSGIDALILYQI